jgi:hypothetical protein
MLGASRESRSAASRPHPNRSTSSARSSFLFRSHTPKSHECCAACAQKLLNKSTNRIRTFPRIALRFLSCRLFSVSSNSSRTSLFPLPTSTYAMHVTLGANFRFPKSQNLSNCPHRNPGRAATDCSQPVPSSSCSRTLYPVNSTVGGMFSGPGVVATDSAPSSLGPLPRGPRRMGTVPKEISNEVSSNEK